MVARLPKYIQEVKIKCFVTFVLQRNYLGNYVSFGSNLGNKDLQARHFYCIYYQIYLCFRVPDPDNYIPPVAQNESQLKGANINLGRDPSRQTFFKVRKYMTGYFIQVVF